MSAFGSFQLEGEPAASANFVAKAKLSRARPLQNFGPRNFFLASKEDRLRASCMERTFIKRTFEVLPPAQSKQNYSSVRRLSTALTSSFQRTFRKALASSFSHEPLHKYREDGR